MKFNRDYFDCEITNPVNLCDINGRLNEGSIGWSKNPNVVCNLSKRWLRKKKWNYWCITGRECLFSVTISNIDYAGMVFVYFFDYKTRKFIEKTIMTPFGKGCNMPIGVNESVEFKNNDMKVSLINDNGNIHILVECANFGGEYLKSDITVVYPEMYETLNVVVPWDDRTFQFTSKHEGLMAYGVLNIGLDSYLLNKQETFACLDFGRGIWPYKVNWNWATVSGMSDGRQIGINLGAKWTDNTGANENGIVVDGKLTKLNENVNFIYNKENLMEPWSINSVSADNIKLIFTPLYERVAKTDIIIIKSEVHQMIGHFEGKIKTEAGEEIIIKEMIGCAEEHSGKW